MTFFWKYFFGVAIVFFLITPSTFAQGTSLYRIQKTVLEKGFTATSSDGRLRISVRSNYFTKNSSRYPHHVFIQNIDRKEVELPKDRKLVSNVYSYTFEAGEKNFIRSDIPLELRYTDDRENVRGIYHYDREKKRWFPLKSFRDISSEGYARAVIRSSFDIIAIFSDTTKRQGVASWYRSKKAPEGAATNLFPLGTRLRVTNLDNNKTVEVTVISTWKGGKGKRIIDIVSTSFKKIARLGEGLINVRIEKIKGNYLE